MAKISRHDLLSGLDNEAAADAGACPICRGAVVPGTDKRPASCEQCGYPRDAAAHVDYDGCC